MTTTRTGQAGSCFEYSLTGKQLQGFDQMTIDQMIDLSQQWPDTYHQYVGPNGYVTWAKGGAEVSTPEFAAS